LSSTLWRRRESKPTSHVSLPMVTRNFRRSLRCALWKWKLAAKELKVTASLYLVLTLAVAADSHEPVQRYFRSLRDVGEFVGVIPDDKDKCLRFANLQLAERITRGLEGCNWAFVGACGELAEGVETYGPLDFRFGQRPDNLVAAANAELADMLVMKVEFRHCRECGRMFRPTRSDQMYHKTCGYRKRKRESRAKKAAGS
jgi:hypothetical protein